MTESVTARGLGKRERLVSGTSDLLYRYGVSRTSLADLAKIADVPLGNIYYYFKTKDELVQAVIEEHAETIRAGLRDFKRHRMPRARLIAFARSLDEQGEPATRYCCPHGSLAMELQKRPDGNDLGAGALLAVFTDRAQQQFASLGRKDAHDLTVAFIASVQGTVLLTGAFRDRNVLRSQARQLERWLNTLT